MKKLLNFYKFIIEKVQDDWFEKNPDFYLSKNKEERQQKNNTTLKNDKLYNELKKFNIDDIKFTYDENRNRYSVIEPSIITFCVFDIERTGDISLNFNTFIKDQLYKIILSFIKQVEKNKPLKSYTFKDITTDAVNLLFRYSNDYYGLFYYDGVDGINNLFLTKDKLLFSDEIKEIKNNENSKIIYFNNKTKGKELTDYETININKIKNELKNISYNDITYVDSNEYDKYDKYKQYKPIFINQEFNDKMIQLGIHNMYFEPDRSENKVYFGHLKNRYHLQGSIGQLRGIGLGYKMYKSFLKYQGYLISDEQTTVDSRKMYYNLMKDEDVYNIIDRDVEHKGQSHSTDSEKILVIWKDNPKLEQIIKIVRDHEKISGRHYEYDKDLQKYLK